MSWGGEESQDLGAGVPAGRSFWKERAGLGTTRSGCLEAYELIRNWMEKGGVPQVGLGSQRHLHACNGAPLSRRCAHIAHQGSGPLTDPSAQGTLSVCSLEGQAGA